MFGGYCGLYMCEFVICFCLFVLFCVVCLFVFVLFVVVFVVFGGIFLCVGIYNVCVCVAAMRGLCLF